MKASLSWLYVDDGNVAHGRTTRTAKAGPLERAMLRRQIAGEAVTGAYTVTQHGTHAIVRHIVCKR
jgi:hypothetical protein